ncbi:MAG TPA: biotin/lipoyl-binding protein [Candidatus Paceibacterota bacterium]|nr:biotin/lipoyl-binding protein [Candidatus Paceibacterota bacterium]
MRRTSFIVFIISLIGISLVSFWIYGKYFKSETPPLLYFTATRGTVNETVRARGDIVTEKDFDLHFPASGIVEKIFVKEGQQVKQGEPLMKLETKDLELELRKLRNDEKQAEANLSIRKAEAGNTESRLSTVVEKQETLVHNAYSTLLSNNLTAEPSEINYNITPPRITGRYAGEQGIYRFTTSQKNIAIKDYVLHVFGLEKVGPILISKTGPTPLGTLGLFVDFPEDLSNYVDKTWILNIPNTKSAAYSNDQNAYQQALKEQSQAIEDARAELATEEGETSIASAKVLQAEAEINSYRSQIAITEEKIRKSTLYAPMDTRITKVWLEKSELALPEVTAITLGTTSFKIQSDISELEIVKINEAVGNTVLIRFDAFPNTTVNGKVFSIEPKEIVKDGDKYYRTNVFIEPNALPLRSGMSADLSIFVSTKDSVLKIPLLAVISKEGKSFVFTIENGKQVEHPIETGISDGESIEVMNGLSEGQTIVVPAD